MIKRIITVLLTSLSVLCFCADDEETLYYSQIETYLGANPYINKPYVSIGGYVNASRVNELGGTAAWVNESHSNAWLNSLKQAGIDVLLTYNILCEDIINDSCWTTGKTGNCLKFDGIDDYVDCGNNDNLNITDAITIEAWVNGTQLQSLSEDYAGILGKGNDYNIRYNRILDRFYARFIIGGEAKYPNIMSNPVEGTWYHLVVTYDKNGGANNFKCYVNGANTYSYTYTGSIGTNDEHLKIGYSYRYFNGLIDSVKIYNQALAPDEISRHYLDKGVYWLWGFDENSGYIALDTSGNENDGVLCSMSSDTCRVDGKEGKALQFDGIDDYVDCGNNDNLNITDAITIEAWVNGTQLQSLSEDYAGILGKGDDYNIRYNRILDRFYARFIIGGEAKYPNIMSNPVEGTWYHLVVTYDKDGGANNFKCYVNGANTYSYTYTGSIGTNDEHLKIGYSYRYFNGLIDSVKIYNQALAASDIYEHYSNTGTYCGGWSMNEGRGHTATDLSSNGNDGALTLMDTSTCWVDGKTGNCLKFDGIDDYVDCGNNDNLNITDAITIEAWVNGTQLQSLSEDYAGILGKGNDYNIRYNRILDRFYARFIIGGEAKYPNIMSNPVEGTWYHLVVTYDKNGGANNFKCYVNGANTYSYTYTGSIGTNDEHLKIGYSYRYFNGLIDSVKIYNRALTQDEIYEHHIKGKTIGIWNFEDERGVIALDISDNMCYGQLNNMDVEGHRLHKYYISEISEAVSNEELIINPLEGFSGTELTYFRLSNDIQYWMIVNDTQSFTLLENEWYYDYYTRNVYIKNPVVGDSYRVIFMVNWKHELQNGGNREIAFSSVVDAAATRLDTVLKDRNGLVDYVRPVGTGYPLNLGEGDRRNFAGYLWASPKNQRDFEIKTGIDFNPYWIVNNGKYGSINYAPPLEYLSWINHINDVVENYAAEITDTCTVNNAKYRPYWGDYCIGMSPYSGVMSNAGVHQMCKGCNEPMVSRLLMDTPFSGEKIIRFSPWFVQSEFSRFLTTAFQDDYLNYRADILEDRWADIKRGLLFNVPDGLTFGGEVDSWSNDTTVKEKMRQLILEFKLTHLMLNGEEIFTHPINVYVVNAWGIEKSWPSWDNIFGSQIVLRNLTDLPVNVNFISLLDIEEDGIPVDADVLLNIGEKNSSYSGDYMWTFPTVVQKINDFVTNGGGFIGIGCPSFYETCVMTFQLRDLLGVEYLDTLSGASSMGTLKGYNSIWTTLPTAEMNKTSNTHWITDNLNSQLSYVSYQDRVQPLNGLNLLYSSSGLVTDYTGPIVGIREYGNGRVGYISGYSGTGTMIDKGEAICNSTTDTSLDYYKLLKRMIFWTAGQEVLYNKINTDTDGVFTYLYPSKNLLVVYNYNPVSKNSTISLDLSLLNITSSSANLEDILSGEIYNVTNGPNVEFDITVGKHQIRYLTISSTE